jgi:hypothetical protein
VTRVPGEAPADACDGRSCNRGSTLSTYAVKSHRLQIDDAAVPYRPTPNRGGALAPTGIVVHDTAGDLAGIGSIDWLCNRAADAVLRRPAL